MTRLFSLYCRLFHGAISHPVNGEYICWHCQRRTPVLWHLPSKAEGK